MRNKIIVLIVLVLLASGIGTVSAFSTLAVVSGNTTRR